MGDRLDSSLERVANRLREAVLHPADNAAREGLARMFDSSLHPRDAKGEWSKKGMGPLKVKGRGGKGGFSVPAQHHKEEVGITPFRPEDDAAGFYVSAKYQRFKTDMRRVAAKNHVTIEHLEQAAGVWQGQTEPSLAIDARDGEAGVTAWAAELGKKFDQDSVLLFHPDPAGDSASYSFALKGRTEEDAINEMQKAGIPGGRIVDGKLELIGKGRDFQKKVDHLADEMALSYNARVGHLTLLERGSYDEAIRKAHAEADAARAEQVAGIKAAAAGRAAAEAGRGVAGGRDQGVGAGNAVAGRVKQGALPRPEGNRAGP